MRRTLIGLAAAAALGSAGGASSATQPTLKLVTRTPLVVSGAHFRAAERVTVRAGASAM